MIKIAFSLFLSSLAFFLTAELFTLSLFSSISLKTFYFLGAIQLLSAMVTLVMAGLLAIIKNAVLSACHYFSYVQRHQRRILFIQGKIVQEKQLYHYRTLKIEYYRDLKRKQLDIADSRKQICSLSQIVDQNLTNLACQVSAYQVKQWRQENASYRRRTDLAALIKLYNTLSSYG